MKHTRFVVLLCLILIGPLVPRLKAQTKPRLAQVSGARIRLSYKGKRSVVDLEQTENVTLGSDQWHRYKLFFTTVKDRGAYFLFQDQGGSPMTNPGGPCGGDSPKTLIWLKTDLKLKVEEAKSEVFDSCAYNGGRYQQGRTRITNRILEITYKDNQNTYRITYNNSSPDKAFAVVELKSTASQ